MFGIFHSLLWATSACRTQVGGQSLDSTFQVLKEYLLIAYEIGEVEVLVCPRGRGTYPPKKRGKEIRTPEADVPQVFDNDAMLIFSAILICQAAVPVISLERNPRSFLRGPGSEQ